MRVKASLTFLAEDAAWSETLYFTKSDLIAVRQLFDPIIRTRARVLGNLAVIKKLRLVNIDARAVGQLYNIDVAGGGGGSDAPWMAAAVNFNSAVGARRVYKVAGLPDGYTRAAHLDKNAIELPINRSIVSLINSFAQSLVTAGAQIAYYDRAQPKLDIATVSSAGIVTLLQAGTFAVGDTFQFYRTTYFGSREAVKGRWRVAAIDADPKVFTILHWPTGRTVQKGQLFKIVPLLSDFTTFSVGDTIDRRTGRPSGRQRGRRLVRR